MKNKNANLWKKKKVKKKKKNCEKYGITNLNHIIIIINKIIIKIYYKLIRDYIENYFKIITGWNIRS